MVIQLPIPPTPKKGGNNHACMAKSRLAREKVLRKKTLMIGGIRTVTIPL